MAGRKSGEHAEKMEHFRGEAVRKVFGEVFDERTVKAVHVLAQRGYIDALEHLVNAGKEAQVFRAADPAGNPRAVKIYKIETSKFKHMRAYIEGDLRFKKVKKSRRELIYQWTRKEFKNLEKFTEAGIRVPMPLAFHENVLVMEFIGGKTAAKTLKESAIDAVLLRKMIVEALARMVFCAELVHADLSEYNILNFNGEPVIIDCAQAVLTTHPSAERFFQRDLENIANYLSKTGEKVGTEELKAEVKALKGKI